MKNLTIFMFIIFSFTRLIGMHFSIEKRAEYFDIRIQENIRFFFESTYEVGSQLENSNKNNLLFLVKKMKEDIKKDYSCFVKKGLPFYNEILNTLEKDITFCHIIEMAPIEQNWRNEMPGHVNAIAKEHLLIDGSKLSFPSQDEEDEEKWNRTFFELNKNISKKKEYSFVAGYALLVGFVSQFVSLKE